MSFWSLSNPADHHLPIPPAGPRCKPYASPAALLHHHSGRICNLLWKLGFGKMEPELFVQQI